MIKMVIPLLELSSSCLQSTLQKENISLALNSEGYATPQLMTKPGSLKTHKSVDL